MTQDELPLNLGDAFLSGNPSGTPRLQIGGQAIGSGVMMRSRTGYAIAERTPGGEIAIQQIPFRSHVASGLLARIPVLRAVVAFVEMLAISIRIPSRAPATSLADALTSRETRRRFGIIAACGFLVLILLPNIIGAAFLSGVLRDPVLNESDHPLAFALAAGGTRLAIVLGVCGVLHLLPGLASLFRYHGAEHRAIAVFEEGREVTVARAQRQSTFHRRCGTVLYANTLLLMIPASWGALALLGSQLGGFPSWGGAGRLAFLSLLDALVFPLVLGAAYELLRLGTGWRGSAAWKPHEWTGWALQRLTILRPSDAQVEVAIVALYAAISIPATLTEPRRSVVPGLVDDESAPAYRPPVLSRPAPDRPRDTPSD